MEYVISEEERAYLERSFVYHAPKEGQPVRYQALRQEAYLLAERILASCPPSRERSLALGRLEEAIMWANAAIARNE